VQNEAATPETASPKVFCIGFQKTGTTSLGNALEMLGYRVTGPTGLTLPDIPNNIHNFIYEVVESGEYDAFQDNPWPVLYKELDARYPGSKFILTLRDTPSWLSSIVRHFGRGRNSPMRIWIYGCGCPEGNEEIYTDRFERHNREVLEYFQHRPNDLLVMNLSEGDGWDELCPFLGKRIPSKPFPHANKATRREWEQSWSFQVLRETKRFARRALGR